MIATGAGAEMRRSLGTAVFSGMLGVTLFGIFLTPVFFYVIQGLGETRLFTAARRAVDRLVLGGCWAAVGFSCADCLVRLPGLVAIVGAVPASWPRCWRWGCIGTMPARDK